MKRISQIVEFNMSDGLTPNQVRKLNANIAYMADLEFEIRNLKRQIAELEKKLADQGG